MPLAAWVLERPWGLAAFALPLVVLLAARRRDQPRAIFSATWSLFEGSAERPAESARTRRRPPPRTWLWAAALAVGAVGLAGPRPALSMETRTWRVVVDRSPSMGLLLGETSRQAEALALAGRELAASWQAGDRVQWVAAGRPQLEFESPRAEPDAAWLATEPAEGGDPDWPLEDRAGTLWVTDAAPVLGGNALLPERAWLLASGGPAVPGAVGVDGADRLDWDGERLVRVAGGAPPRWVDVRSAPGALGAIARVWAAARGLALAPASAGDPPALVISGPSADAPASEARAGPSVVRTRVSGAGWSAACSVLDGDLDGGSDRTATEPPGEVLLLDGRGQPCVLGARGSLRHNFLSFEDPEGDPGAFAHTWARRLDGLLPAAPGVLAVAERRAAGGRRSVPGLPPVSDQSLREPPPIAAWCAALAAVLGVLASALARPGLPTRRAGP